MSAEECPGDQAGIDATEKPEEERRQENVEPRGALQPAAQEPVTREVAELRTLLASQEKLDENTGSAPKAKKIKLEEAARALNKATEDKKDVAEHDMQILLDRKKELEDKIADLGRALLPHQGQKAQEDASWTSWAARKLLLPTQPKVDRDGLSADQHIGQFTARLEETKAKLTEINATIEALKSTK